MSTKICDHRVVGNIIMGTGRPGCGPKGKTLISKRVKRPTGHSSPAGHWDAWTNSMDVLLGETKEETGLEVVDYKLIYADLWRPSVCKRTSQRAEPGHFWTVYETECRGAPIEAPDENSGLRWVDDRELHELAVIALAYAEGRLTHEEWDAQPGIEPLWVRNYVLAGRLPTGFWTAEKLRKIDELCLTIPVKGGS